MSTTLPYYLGSLISDNNPLAAINDIKRDLHATESEIALSLSIFIIVQGGSPLFWSAVSEIKGRKVSTHSN